MYYLIWTFKESKKLNNQMYISQINNKNLGLNTNIDFRILREDLFPFFGGGNKARKLRNILAEILEGKYNAVVTTGSVYSNHCRAAALMCSNYGFQLSLVLHGNEKMFTNGNSNAQIIKALGPKITFCDPDDISKRMDQEMTEFKNKGLNPYYLQGGGHNKRGVEAYINFVQELNTYLKYLEWKPDYIFLPSGTGSTQAGIILGIGKFKIESNVIGISIARKKDKGIEAIYDVFGWFDQEYEHPAKDRVIFEDAFLEGGYGHYNQTIRELSITMFKAESIFLDPVYTSKALLGTLKYINTQNLKGNILFLCTGGTYNFFNTIV